MIRKDEIYILIILLGLVFLLAGSVKVAQNLLDRFDHPTNAASNYA